MPKSPEQFDFSKKKDQKNFEELPKKKQEQIINGQEDEARVIDKEITEKGVIERDKCLREIDDRLGEIEKELAKEVKDPTLAELSDLTKHAEDLKKEGEKLQETKSALMDKGGRLEDYFERRDEIEEMEKKIFEMGERIKIFFDQQLGERGNIVISHDILHELKAGGYCSCGRTGGCKGAYFGDINIARKFGEEGTIIMTSTAPEKYFQGEQEIRHNHKRIELGKDYINYYEAVDSINSYNRTSSGERSSSTSLKFSPNSFEGYFKDNHKEEKEKMKHLTGLAGVDGSSELLYKSEKVLNILDELDDELKKGLKYKVHVEKEMDKMLKY